jgi:DNA modification methylase
MQAWEVRHGDCREVMATLDAESVDAIVCDPPYGLTSGKKGGSGVAGQHDEKKPFGRASQVNVGGFMGMKWDNGVPGVEFWTEALRVAKPGAHLLAFGGTRTYHRLACAIEDAGWEIRDCVMWVYGSGFPKSHDISKAIDKAAGAEREVVGPNPWNHVRNHNPEAWNGATRTQDGSYGSTGSGQSDITAPATDAARQWSGWGTALKPAWEPIIVARKPLVGTVAENVLRHGTGGINVDGCRVGGPLAYASGGFPERTNRPEREGREESGGRAWARAGEGVAHREVAGRWPANLIHDGSEEVVGLFPDRDGAVSNGSKGTTGSNGIYNEGWGAVAQKPGRADSGSAARFFYCAKASKADRDEGCEGLEAKVNPELCDTGYESPTRMDGKPCATQRNHHPTVKPTALMRYLCRLVTPPGGIVLDPFTGSGSTGKGAVLEGFGFIGIEREAEYVEIAKARIGAVAKPAGGLFA